MGPTTELEAPPVSTPEHNEDAQSAATSARPIVELWDEHSPSPEEAADKAEEILDVLVALKNGARRDGQVRMARDVAANLVRQIPLLASGGTGIGKSLAYLAGILGSGKVSVVATHTKALQDQLVDDLDSLFGQIDFQPPIHHALLKGRSAYACLNKVKGAPTEDGQDQLFEDADAGPATQMGKDIVQLHEWVDNQLKDRKEGKPKSSGDRTDVPFPISGKAWEQVSVSSEDCLGKGCPFYTECFAEYAKAEASEASIVVANQAILAMGMQLPNAKILPEQIDAVVVDECHEMESVVADTFGAEITMKRLNSAVKKCKPMADAGGKSVEDLQEAATQSIAALFSAIKVDPKEPADRQFMTKKVESAMESCRDRFQALFDRSSMLPAGDEAQKAAKDRLRRVLGNVVSDFDLVLAGNGDTQVIWASYNKVFNVTTIHAAQFDVAEIMFEKLIKEYKSVTFTSATMTIGGRFDHIVTTAGFDRGPWTSMIAESPFDYQNNSLLYQPSGAPDLKSPDYQAWVADQTAWVAKAMGGRTLLLCSSWKGVEESAEHLNTKYRGQFNVIVQERNSAFRRLKQRFEEEDNSILVGTMSLWTGLSIEGDRCTATLIDRVPFPSPKDPIKAAQSEAADRKFGKMEGFKRVSIPHAATKITQGGGRLIRTVKDRGVLMPLDPRLRRGDEQYKRMYAQSILKSLPPMRLTADAEDVLQLSRVIRTAAGEA